MILPAYRSLITNSAPPPSANDDFFGVSLFNPFSLVVQERDVLYVWLKDGAGNVDYQNWVSVDLLFDDDPVTGVEAILVSEIP